MSVMRLWKRFLSYGSLYQFGLMQHALDVLTGIRHVKRCLMVRCDDLDREI